MDTKDTRTIKTSGGFFQEVSLRARLILRLMLDKRVSPWLKLLPVGSLIYLVNPIDIPGPFDDIAVVSLGLYLFVDLCPQGSLIERIRAAGYGLGGVVTPTGVGTTAAEGKKHLEIEGKVYLLELPVRADFALVAARRADCYGNLCYALTARNFNPIIARPTTW